MGKPTEVDRILRPNEETGSDLAQLVGPTGNLLSTIASGVRGIGKGGLGNPWDLTSSRAPPQAPSTWVSRAKRSSG